MQLHAGGETATVAVADCGRFDISHEAYLTDIARMAKLHEGPLLDMLRRRYFEDDIYTFSTEIVIAINPYKVLTGVDDIEAFISKLEAAEAMAEVSAFRYLATSISSHQLTSNRSRKRNLRRSGSQT